MAARMHPAMQFSQVIDRESLDDRISNKGVYLTHNLDPAE